MATAVRMPQLGESVVEGTVARWLKSPGESIDKLDALLEISTDKIDTEVPAPAAGTLLRIVAHEGQTVAAGAILAYIGNPDEALPAPPQADAPPISAHEPTVEGADVAASAARAGDRALDPAKFISPVVARIAAENKIDLTHVTGTGLGGRITKQDMLAYVAENVSRKAAPATPAAQPLAHTAEHTAEHTADNGVTTAEDDAFILQPLTTMRRMIAEHMVLSKRTSPHVTSIMEADMTAVVQHRAAHHRTFARQGIALTYTAYFMVAAAAALRAVPSANSRYTEAGIELHKRIHIGMAVAVKQGLMVPVLRNVDLLGLQEIAHGVQDLARRARDGKLLPDEIQGGTFTVTNHGTGGSLVATPIIHQPQAAIMGIGAIVKRPVVRTSSPSLMPSADDAIVIRPMCYLNFTFDHRVLDGAVADKFLTAFKATLENWT